MIGRQAHRTATTVLSLAMIAIGIALAIEAVSGSSALTSRLLLGALFVAGGSGRLYIEMKRGRRT